MEKMQLVRVRGETWAVEEARTYDACRLLTLCSIGGGATRRRHILAPFDDVVEVSRKESERKMTAVRWRRACRALLASDNPPGSLRTASRARIDLLPHQLEPALAVLAGQGTRLLLADDVGLGKTIQAALVVAELFARHAIERALILTPPGLRDQWADELSRRFGLSPVRADGRAVRERLATLPFGTNPWKTMPVAIASLDYVKRPEVLPAVSACHWDVVVLDEAHGAAGDSDRRSAAEALASRAAYVILLTATPHNGDDRAFAALRDLGALPGERPLIVFRRRRHEIRESRTRRVHTLRVFPTRFERHMHRALARYQRVVRAEHGERALALSVLNKRAFSSAWSLAQSVDRRLASLEASIDANVEHQLMLPMDDADGERVSDDAPPIWPADLALADAAKERHLLTAISEAARWALRSQESKILTLRRLLRRCTESVLIFTEYRDTALHLRSALGFGLILHGGLGRDERLAVLDRFTRTPRTVLIATDAAGQGLNLQHACRLVVNLELPWNPMRLEQRIGRVDRIGQPRRVHAVHFVAGGTGEIHVLARLKARIASARSMLDAPDPLSDAVTDPPTAPGRRLVIANLSELAGKEVCRLQLARACAVQGDELWLSELLASPWWILEARRRRLRVALSGRCILIYRVFAEDASGNIAGAQLVAISIPQGSLPNLKLSDAAGFAVEKWRATSADLENRFWQTRQARERALTRNAAAQPISPFQPALFDRRATRLHDEQRACADEQIVMMRERLAAISRQSAIVDHASQLLLIVRP